MLSLSNVFMSGAGFLADAYDLFVINIVVDIMDRVKYAQPLTNSSKSMLKSISLIGAIVGQVFFGATADIIGRKKLFICTACLVISGSLLSSIVQNSNMFGIYTQLILCRFLLGIGIGNKFSGS